jgi:AAA+ ATPase superfamily predicted ATPase
MTEVFRGRTRELAILDKLYRKKGFSMTVLYGRRRIGKTMLFNKFMKEQDCKCISFTAVERSEAELLSMLTDTVIGVLAPDMLGSISFRSFDDIFSFIGKQAKNERIIFFIDEYPYLAKQCPYIQSLLQKTIDTDWKGTNLFFVICGSLISFMKDEVLAESAPLHGRTDLELKLKPFNYLETAEFFEGYSYEEKAICYGLTNGVGKYIDQFDPEISLEENIIDQFYSGGGYFTEEQIKTSVAGDRKNHAVFNSIISAIATGHSKHNEIATYAGMDDIAYPLKVLSKAELIEKRISKRSYYVINDSMLEFWFRYVNRATSLINADNGEAYYRAYVKDELHDYMGHVFEKMSKEYLMLNAGKRGIPIVTDITDYQNSIIDDAGNKRQIEIDLLGKNGKDILLAGECKFKSSPFDKSDYDSFMDKIKYLSATDPVICLFSLGGFTDQVRKEAKGCILVDIKDMYEIK